MDAVQARAGQPPCALLQPPRAVPGQVPVLRESRAVPLGGPGSHPRSLPLSHPGRAPGAVATT
eukprot:7820376-Lingulodinium_polyedra.AAC.1